MSTTRTKAQEVASRIVDSYFASVVLHHIPDDQAADAAPTNLSRLCDDVERAIDEEFPGNAPGTFRADAGYLIGVEVGLRLRGGAR